MERALNDQLTTRLIGDHTVNKSTLKSRDFGDVFRDVGSKYKTHTVYLYVVSSRGFTKFALFRCAQRWGFGREYALLRDGFVYAV